MEWVAVTTDRLEGLAQNEPTLKPWVGVFANNTLPLKDEPRAYIINTDPIRHPGQHWIAIWTYRGACEKMDSYGLPITYYESTPLEELIANQQSVQAVNSAMCSHYAL